ncbi:MAG: hypothetical protein AAGF57_06495 [Pseudomonadota bacterium]
MLRLFLLAATTLLIALSRPGVYADTICGEPNISCPALVYQGLTYPYQREPDSYLFIDGTTYPYAKITEHLLGDSEVALPGNRVIRVSDLLSKLQLEDHVGQRLYPIVGYGSNPAPAQLSRKFAKEISTGSVVMPVLKGSIEGYDVVWTPLFVRYGGMPATLFPSEGTNTDIWVNWMTESERARTDETENLSGSWYIRTALPPNIATFRGPAPTVIEVYLSCYGALDLGEGPIAVKAIPARGRQFSAMSSPDILQAVLHRFSEYDTVVDLVFANASDPTTAVRNTHRLEDLRLFPGLQTNPREGCSTPSDDIPDGS